MGIRKVCHRQLVCQRLLIDSARHERGTGGQAARGAPAQQKTPEANSLRLRRVGSLGRDSTASSNFPTQCSTPINGVNSLYNVPRFGKSFGR
ncbi:MAG: hypothetical protein QF593_01385, partial [Nitrospinota bacterium]|nr:hypothetical protein [Nitrospinota bacterium]